MLKCDEVELNMSEMSEIYTFPDLIEIGNRKKDTLCITQNVQNEIPGQKKNNISSKHFV